MTDTQQPITPPASGGHVFEKVALFPGQTGVGTLTAYPGRFEFESSRMHLSVTDVREVAFEFEKIQADALARTPRVRVVHGTGDDLSTLYLIKSQYGLPRKVKAANEAFAADLAAACGTTTLTDAERVRAGRGVAQTEARGFEAQARAGRMSMAISAVVFVIGALVTLVSYSAAEAGGSYVVAWGAMVFGALFFLAGYLQYRGAARSKADAEKRAGTTF